MRPESSEERPSYLVDEEPPASAPEASSIGSLEPDQYVEEESTAEPGVFDRVGPVAIVSVAISLGAMLAIGAALYTSMNKPEPTMYDNAEQGPANEAGSVPVHKGIKKSSDRFGN